MLFNDIEYNVFNLNRDIFSPRETLIHGCLFKDEVSRYKDYNFLAITAKNKQDELLLKIYELDQVINDLNLYLDLHPNDDYFFNLFKKYSKELREHMNEYESSYGPLVLSDTDYSKYMWSSNPWPWESDGVKYV